MKILFISNLVADYSGYEPLGILFLAGALKQAGHECRYAHHQWDEVVREMDRFKPRIVAFSVTTGTHQLYLDLNRRIRERYEALSLFGGPHGTFFPQLIHEEGVDVVCVGEGEGAMVELCDRLERGEEIRDVQNLVVKLPSGEVVHNPVRNYIADLDSIPLPDRSILYDKYPECSKSKFKFFMASRGCPFKCTYCFNHYYHKIYKGKGRVLRLRSVDHLIEEIQETKENHHMEFVKFLDDIFLFDMDWMRRFRDSYSREIGLPFYCCVRASMVTEEKIALLREAGCHSVAMAIEAGNDELRNKILKRNMSKETIVDACRILRNAGIKIFTQNMVGLPGGSLEMDFETMDLNIACRPDYSWVSQYAPFPNTELGEYARELGYFDGDIDSFQATYHQGSPMRIPDKMKVNNLQKLFALGVEFPSLAPFIKDTLIHLPLTPLYELIRKIFKGYCFKNRIYKARYNLIESVKLAWGFLKGAGG